MKHTIFLLIICGFILGVGQQRISSAAAENAGKSRRGLITTGACPLTCRDLGVAEEFCREGRMGNKCSVEDLSQPPGHRSLAWVRRGQSRRRTAAPMPNKAVSLGEVAGEDAPVNDPSRRGLVTTSSCPYTCVEAGIPQGFCRESRAGNSCQVEDLRQPPGHRSMIRLP